MATQHARFAKCSKIIEIHLRNRNKWRASLPAKTKSTPYLMSRNIKKFYDNPNAGLQGSMISIPRQRHSAYKMNDAL